RLLRQVLPFGVEREAVVLGERVQRLDVIRRRRLRPRRDGALAQGCVAVGDDQIGVDVLLDAEPAAFRAGAERVVEREQPRLDFRNGEAGYRAGEFLGEHEPARVGRGRCGEFCLLAACRSALPCRLLGLLPPPLAGEGWGGGTILRRAMPRFPSPSLPRTRGRGG